MERTGKHEKLPNPEQNTNLSRTLTPSQGRENSNSNSKRTATMGIHETRQGTRNCKRIQRHCGIPHRYQHLTTSNLARRHLPHDSALRVRDRPRNREQHRFPTPKPKQEPRQERAGQNHAYLEPLVTIRPPTHGIRRGAAPRVPLPQIQA